MIKVIGEITADTFFRYAEQIEKQIAGNQKVFISSPGGDIGYTLAMLDDIDWVKRETLATGICQSAAAVLATAGEGKRVCTMDTLFRFIPPEREKYIDENGQEAERVHHLRHFLHSLLVARLQSRLKWSLAETNDLFDGEFISSTRAKELGLVDEVISTEVSNGRPIIDRRPNGKIDNSCLGYFDRFHHDGGNEHYDRYQCVRPKGHKGEHFDYLISGDLAEGSDGDSNRLSGCES